MSRAIDNYISEIISTANQTGEDAEDIRNELEDHLFDTVTSLEEAGLPREDAVFEAIQRSGPPAVIGDRLRRPWGLIDVRSRGTAKGVIAIGPRAIGVVAIGGVPFGIVSIGGCAIGLFSIGGLGLGLIAALGGLAVGSLASGGMALGLIATGGLAVGAVALGGLSVGLHALQMGSNKVVSHFSPDEVPVVLKSLEGVAFWLMREGRPVFFGLLVVSLLLVGVASVLQRRQWLEQSKRSWIWD